MKSHLIDGTYELFGTITHYLPQGIGTVLKSLQLEAYSPRYWACSRTAPLHKVRL